MLGKSQASWQAGIWPGGPAVGGSVGRASRRAGGQACRYASRQGIQKAERRVDKTGRKASMQAGGRGCSQGVKHAGTACQADSEGWRAGGTAGGRISGRAGMQEDREKEGVQANNRTGVAASYRCVAVPDPGTHTLCLAQSLKGTSLY